MPVPESHQIPRITSLDPEKTFDLFVRNLRRLSYFERRVALWDGKTPKLRRFLYKFRALDCANDVSVDRMRDLIVRSRFWLSSPLDFNDPFDGRGKFIAESSARQKRERLKSLLKRQGLKFAAREKLLALLARKSNDVYEELVREFYQSHLQKLGICSFGGDPRSILMWSHYSNHHTGAWLQFESARDPVIFTRVVPMKYSEGYPVVNWINDFDEGLQILMERKHVGWKYEHESRLHIMDAASSYLQFEPEALRGICFGCRSSDQTIKKVRELIAERINNGSSHPKLYEAKQDDSSYKLSIHKL